MLIVAAGAAARRIEYKSFGSSAQLRIMPTEQTRRCLAAGGSDHDAAYAFEAMSTTWTNRLVGFYSE